MREPVPPGRRVACVGAVIHDGKGRLLLVRRARPPAQGRWSIPGGRVEAGETGEQALAREVREETGLRVDVGRLVGTVERDGPDGLVYVIKDHQCRVLGGELCAGDDASEVRWVAIDELRRLETSEGLIDTLGSWGLLPR